MSTVSENPTDLKYLFNKQTGIKKIITKKNYENSPVVILLIGLGVVVSLILNGLTLFHTLVPRNYYGEREVANEYFLDLEEFKDFESAKSRYDKFYAFSMEYIRKGIEKTDPCYLGIDPDHLVLVRSLNNKGEWIIGLDRIPGQGDIRGDKGLYEDIEKIKNRLDWFKKNECVKEYSFTLPSASILDDLQGLYSKNIVFIDYYSVSRYSSLYGEPLDNYDSKGL